MEDRRQRRRMLIDHNAIGRVVGQAVLGLRVRAHQDEANDERDDPAQDQGQK